MSYTNQEVSWEAHGLQDDYGDLSYRAARTIKARKQPKQELIKTSEGKEVLSRTFYYVDPRQEENALNIQNADRLDGELIVARYVMCDFLNRPKMVRLVTV